MSFPIHNRPFPVLCSGVEIGRLPAGVRRLGFGLDEEAARNATPFSTNRVFNQFFGGDPNADTKKLLAARLAKGEIDAMTYKMAMDALK